MKVAILFFFTISIFAGPLLDRVKELDEKIFEFSKQIKESKSNILKLEKKIEASKKHIKKLKDNNKALEDKIKQRVKFLFKIINGKKV